MTIDMGVHNHWITPVGDSGWYLLNSDGDTDTEEESEEGCDEWDHPADNDFDLSICLVKKIPVMMEVDLVNRRIWISMLWGSMSKIEMFMYTYNWNDSSKDTMYRFLWCYRTTGME